MRNKQTKHGLTTYMVPTITHVKQQPTSAPAVHKSRTDGFRRFSCGACSTGKTTPQRPRVRTCPQMEGQTDGLTDAACTTLNCIQSKLSHPHHVTRQAKVRPFSLPHFYRIVSYRSDLAQLDRNEVASGPDWGNLDEAPGKSLNTSRAALRLTKPNHTTPHHTTPHHTTHLLPGRYPSS